MSLLLALTATGGGGAFTLTADSGVYTLSGVSVSLLKGKLITASAGSYALNGVSAGLYRTHKLTANAGAYSYTGIAANVVKSKLLPANAGAYAFSGNAASLVYTPLAVAYTLAASSGSYAVSGKDAVLSHSGGSVSYLGEFILERKKVYIKRGKQYLIFNNNDEADSYLAAESAIEAAKQSSRGAAKRVIKALKVVKPTIAPEPKLEELSDLIAKFNVDYDVIQLQKNNDIEALYHIQSMLYALQQDEEDIELLLLAI